MGIEQLHVLGYFVDTYDSRLLSMIQLPSQNGGLDLFVNKLLSPEDCKNPIVSKHIAFQPTKEHPLAFYQETASHSCKGVFWQVRFPFNNGDSKIDRNLEIKLNMISGHVYDASVQVEVVLVNWLRSVILERLSEFPQFKTPEEVALHVNLLSSYPHERRYHSPFTIEFVGEDQEALMVRSKKCGFAYGNRLSYYDNEKVKPQLQLKLNDVRRIYKELTKMEFSDIPEIQKS